MLLLSDTKVPLANNQRQAFYEQPGPNERSDDPYRDPAMHHVGAIFSNGWYWLD